MFRLPYNGVLLELPHITKVVGDQRQNTTGQQDH